MNRWILSLLTVILCPIGFSSAQALEATPGQAEECPEGVKCHLWKEMKKIETAVLEDLNARRDQLTTPEFDDVAHYYSGVCAVGGPGNYHYAAAFVEPYEDGIHLTSSISSLQPSEPSQIENEDPYKNDSPEKVRKHMERIAAERFAVRTASYKDIEVVFNDFTAGEYPIRYWYYMDTEQPDTLQYAGYFQYSPIQCTLKKRW